MLLQQGDILIESVDEIPKDLKRIRGRIVLAEGESTGHAHIIENKSAKAYKTDNIDELFLELSEDTKVKHEEHKALMVPPGIYKVRRVREYNHFEEEARRVQD